MKITTEQLNEVAAILGTTDKNAILSVVIGTLVKEGGLTVRDAINAVFGEGGFDKVASHIQNGLIAAK